MNADDGASRKLGRDIPSSPARMGDRDVAAAVVKIP
jgi:hypothetical protein